MKLTLESLITALIRLGALMYAGVCVVSVVYMLAVSAFSRVPGMPGLDSAMVSVLASPIVLGTLAFIFSKSLARFICAGLDEPME